MMSTMIEGLRPHWLAALVLAPAAVAQVAPGDLVLNVWQGDVDLIHTRPDGTVVATFTTASSPGKIQGAAITASGELFTSRWDPAGGFSLFDVAGTEFAVDPAESSWTGDTDVLAAGDLLVVEQGGRVEAFSPSGAHLRTYGAAELAHPWGLHVDLEDTIWVADISAAEGIQRFHADGTRLSAWVVPYDPSDLVRSPDGSLWVIGDDARLHQYAPDGTLLQQFATVLTGGATGIALAHDGTLLVCEYKDPEIHRYSTDGNLLETVPVPAAEPGGILFMNAVRASIEDIGQSYCGPANLNSSGGPALLTASGSSTVIINLVELHACQLPPNEIGYFLNSMTQDFIPFPPGSQGNLCLGGGIGRYVDDIASSGAAGELHLQLDLTDTPTPGGPVAIQAGETWNFQCWFRDKNPGATSNFTDGVSIAFE